MWLSNRGTPNMVNANVQLRETVFGFTVEGRWEDVVETSEELTETIKEEADEQSVEDWDEWRPRHEESHDDVREKTVEKACVSENPVEQSEKSAVETAGEAVGDMGRAVEEVTKGNTDEASDKSQRAVVEAALSVDTVFRKAVRRVEVFVYRNIVSRTNPYYFDGEAVSASLQKKRSIGVTSIRESAGEEREYCMDVEIHDGDVRDRCREELVGA